MAGYPQDIDAWRETEFPQLKDQVYLDYAGASMYSATQVRTFSETLTGSLFGNPHSGNPSSSKSSAEVTQVRNIILRHFNTDSNEYAVVFTSGATESLQILARNFAFRHNIYHENASELDETFDETSDSDERDSDDEGGQRRLSKREIGKKDSRDDSDSWDSASDGSDNDESPVETFKQRGMSSTTSDPTNTGEYLYPAADDDPTAPEFAYLAHNHTSVVGMRAIASARDARARCIKLGHMRDTSLFCEADAHAKPGTFSLFVYPAQCNFSGRKFPLSWIADIQSGKRTVGSSCTCHERWKVCLDAASFVSTSTLDLSDVTPDFVTLSFYKMFGLPTGLGALLVRRSSAHLLRNNHEYFGGGTVSAYSSSHLFRVPRANIEDQLEHGTISYLDIIALKCGFESIGSISMKAIQEHTHVLGNKLRVKMVAMRHYNDTSVAVLYPDEDGFDNLGPVVTFNLLRADGSWVGFAEVEKLASIENIHLRTGCFCNVGACHDYLHISFDQLRENVRAGYACGDDNDLMRGRPVGAVRISFGWSSAESDVDAFVAFIEKFFVESSQPANFLSLTSPKRQQRSRRTSVGAFTVKKICLYPVKSCGAMNVDKWCIGKKGFLFDRQWMIVESGACLTQKKEARLCLIKPCISVTESTLRLSAPDMPDLIIPINDKGGRDVSANCRARVCFEKVVGEDMGDEAAEWLFRFLNRPCRLAKQPVDQSRTCRLSSAVGAKPKLSYANESQFLLVNEASMSEVNRRSASTEGVPIDRFRANIVIDGGTAFEEDLWKSIEIGSNRFGVVGPCRRCQMVCVDQETGNRTAEPLRSLASFRRYKGQTFFGIHLVRSSASATAIHVGEIVRPNFEE